jgi:hypothetical protein
MRRLRKGWITAAALSAALFALAAEGAVVSEQGETSFAQPQIVSAFDQGVAVVRGELGAGDVDFYTVELVAGQLLFAALFDAQGGAFLDTRLGVFAPGSPAGAPDAQDDDGGRGFLSRRAVAVETAGVWKIAVTGFRDTGFTGAHAEALGSPAAYQLVIGVATPPLDFESEGNDTEGTADALLGGGIVRGELAGGDVDRYEIQPAAGDQVLASLFEIDTGSDDLVQPGGGFHDTRLGLFAPGGATPAAEDDDGGPGLFSNLAGSAGASGDWTLGVTGFRDTGYTGVHPEGFFGYVLVAALAPTEEVLRCEVVAPADRIDIDDINAIFAARNTPASGPDDPRDADGDGTITVVDSSLCRLECTYPRCRKTATPPACGLLGVEPLVILGLLGARRRARARREAEVSR